MSECKHLNAIIHGHLPMGTAYCPDCHDEVRLYVVFNNVLDEVRDRLHKLDLLTENLEKRDVK